MASYAAKTDLDAHFGVDQVLIAADRDGDGVVDTGVIEAAVLKASEEIDSYIGVKYTLPLVSTPNILLAWCCEITMYKLSAESGSLTDEKRTRYRDAVAWLKDVSAGRATLGVSESVAVADDTVETSTDNPDRLFTRTTLEGLL